MTIRAGSNNSNNGTHPNGAPKRNGVDRLMHGEDIQSRSPEQITHWITAYQELLGFKDRLLNDMNQSMKSLSKPASAEIQELDVNLIVTQRERYVRRLDFWLTRQTDVSREMMRPN
jgi:ABC-type transporter MlaC component